MPTKPEIVITERPSHLAKTAADIFVRTAKDWVAEKGWFFLAISGGSTPRAMHKGIGQDGHTASLFPGQRALDEQKKWVVAVKGGNPDVGRLTMTFPLLNRARHVVFLVSGKEKAATVKTILEDRKTSLPAQSIQPLRAKLTWLLDREAASLLSG